MNRPSILIVNYGFPSNPGIGGRRWAIFAKYLTIKGYSVHVLMQEPRHNSKSDFDVYVQDNTFIKKHFITGFYPKALSEKPTSIWTKIKYTLWMKFMYLVSKGTPYDKAIFGKKRFRKSLLDLHSKYSFKFIIVSGAPFRLCYYAALEKDKLNIPLLVDFRDPWTWGSGYGYGALKQRRKEHEAKMESATVSRADFVTVPVENMRDILMSKYPECKNKIILLPHGYDENIIRQYDGNRFKNNRVLRIVYFGSVYDRIDDKVKALSKRIRELNGGAELTFYTMSPKYESIFAEDGILNKFVYFKKNVPQEKLFDLIGEFDFVLMIHPDFAKDNLSTKIYETIRTGTPVLYLGEGGVLSDFLTSTSSGIHLTTANLENQLIPEDMRTNFTYTMPEIVTKYSYSNLTDELLFILNRLK